jgi:hypothetical protein
MVGYSFLDDSFIRNPMPVLSRRYPAVSAAHSAGTLFASPLVCRSLLYCLC